MRGLYKSEKESISGRNKRKQRKLVMQLNRRKMKDRKRKLMARKYIKVFAVCVIIFVSIISTNQILRKNNINEKKQEDKDTIYSI